jgi:hypothetical protein
MRSIASDGVSNVLQSVSVSTEQLVKPRQKLGELLVQAGVLDEVKLNAALSEQQRWGGRLGRILVSMSFLTEDAIAEALSEQLNIPRTNFSSLNVPAWVTQKIDIDFARANSLCPERISSDGKSIVIAMADPINVMSIDEIMHRTGMRVRSTLAGERAIDRAIGMVYGADFEQDQESIVSNVFLNNQGRTYDGLPARPPSTGATDAGASPIMDEKHSQQQKALQVMVGLLIDKGVFTREEFLSQLGKA